MNDLISRQAAIDAADKIIERDTSGNNDVVKAMTAWKTYVEGLPSVQPEIVRCKDCRYADEDGVCQNSKGLAIQDDYDFCSYAKRRTDGEIIPE